MYSYYYNSEGNINVVFLFRYFNIATDKFEYYLSSEYSASGVMISKYKFANNLLLNDIIKISDKTIAFTIIQLSYMHYIIIKYYLI